LHELALLYRVKTGELSEQRTRTHDQELIRYLNGLCLRAYVHLAPAVPRVSRLGTCWRLLRLERGAQRGSAPCAPLAH
jgi:hypothetical protein